MAPNSDTCKYLFIKNIIIITRHCPPGDTTFMCPMKATRTLKSYLQNQMQIKCEYLPWHSPLRGHTLAKLYNQFPHKNPVRYKHGWGCILQQKWHYQARGHRTSQSQCWTSSCRPSRQWWHWRHWTQTYPYRCRQVHRHSEICNIFSIGLDLGPMDTLTNVLLN